MFLISGWVDQGNYDGSNKKHITHAFSTPQCHQQWNVWQQTGLNTLRGACRGRRKWEPLEKRIVCSAQAALHKIGGRQRTITPGPHGVGRSLNKRTATANNRSSAYMGKSHTCIVRQAGIVCVPLLLQMTFPPDRTAVCNRAAAI